MNNEELITYEKLYEILRLEKYKKELQQLDPSFFEKVSRYMAEKKSILKDYQNKSSVFAEKSILKSKKQLENIHLLLRELYEKREAKIVQMALFNSRTGDKPENSNVMLSGETELYESLLKILATTRLSVLESMIQGKSIIETENNIKSVKFLEIVSEFVGEDMNTYGPFQADEVSNIPIKVAEILIKNNMAKEV